MKMGRNGSGLPLVFVLLVLFSMVLTSAEIALAKATPPTSTTPSATPQAPTETPLPTPKLSVANVEVSYGQSANLTATVLIDTIKGRGAAQFTGQVTFFVDGQNVGTASPNTQGTASQAFAPADSMHAGAHVIKATYSGDQNLGNAEASGTLTVDKAKVVLSFEIYPNNGTLTGNMLMQKASNPQAAGPDGRAIHMFLNGKDVGTVVTTMGDGPNVTYPMPTNGATATLVAKFDGDNVYQAATATKVYQTEQPVTPYLYSPPSQVGVTYGGRVDVIAYLYRDTTKARPLPGRTILFSIMTPNELSQMAGGALLIPPDAVQITGKTDQQGVARVSWTCTLPAGQYAVCPCYQGDAGYTSVINYAPTTEMITVHHAEVEVTASPSTMTAQIDQNVTVTATVKTKADGAAVAGVPVNFLMGNSVVATATTDGQGRAQGVFAVPSAAGLGTQTLIVQMPATHRYATAEGQCKINIQPSEN